LEQLHVDEIGEGVEIQIARPFWGIPIPTDIDEDPLFEGLLLLEPRNEFDQCIIGVVRRFNDRFVLYSKQCVLQQLTNDMEGEDDYEQAMEHFEFNVAGAFVGEHTPGFLEDGDEVF